MLNEQTLNRGEPRARAHVFPPTYLSSDACLRACYPYTFRGIAMGIRLSGHSFQAWPAYSETTCGVRTGLGFNRPGRWQVKLPSAVSVVHVCAFQSVGLRYPSDEWGASCCTKVPDIGIGQFGPLPVSRSCDDARALASEWQRSFQPVHCPSSRSSTHAVCDRCSPASRA
jgi:hypothetical protein